MATFVSDDDDDAPLALAQLRHRLTAATYAWLWKEEQQSEIVLALADDDNDETATASANNIYQRDDDEEYYPRVHEWSSSVGNPDGIGGYCNYDHQHDAAAADGEDAPPAGVEARDAVTVRVQYISNLLADPVQCRRLLLLRDDENPSVVEEPAATCTTD